VRKSSGFLKIGMITRSTKFWPFGRLVTLATLKIESTFHSILYWFLQKKWLSYILGILCIYIKGWTVRLGREPMYIAWLRWAIV
jgi:hypothetical protein